MNYTPENVRQWNLDQNASIFIKENYLENVC